MQAFVVLLTVALVLVAHVVAVAGSGDPRLVNGVLEWPRTVTNEPFLVVRGDDGVLYYVGIAAARRDGPLAGGARVSVLGLEGRTANEITALGVGAGETTEAALAHLQGARPAPATSAPVVAAPPAVVPATAATGTPTPSAAPAPAAPAAAPATLPGPAGDDRRRTEISGVVGSLVGRTLILRSDEGRVAVDVSSLSPSLERMVTPGTMVRVYGVPVEMRFKAMGFFDPGGR